MAINATQKIIPLKTLLSTIAKTNEKGNSQVINHFRYNNAPMVEITTDLGKGLQGVREVYYDVTGAMPQRIINKIADRIEVYTSAKPEMPCGVIQEIEGIKSYLPNLSMEKLASY